MKVAIIGATGAVGREMVSDLESSKIPDIELLAMASPRSAGEKVTFRGKNIEVKVYDLTSLRGVPYALMSAGGKFSRQHTPAIVEQGTTVIDNSSAWRMHQDVLLVVPEVNGSLLKNVGTRPTIIANPNCSTIQMVVALKPFQDAIGIDMVQVATYQSVSGTGQKGIKELGDQVSAHLRFATVEPNVYAQPIAFNVLPAIDVLDEAGHCFEEEKMVRETRKIMGMNALDILATTARVPTFNCHSEAVVIKLKAPITRERALQLLRQAPGIRLVEENDHAAFGTPHRVAGDSTVWVSRVRLPLDQVESNWVQFWVVADNLKKGAATNAVQILEMLARV